MTKRRGRGRGGSDDLHPTLKAMAARIQESAEKARAAARIDDQIARVVAMGRALEEFNETKAAVRQELEANIREAIQVGDLKRAVTFKRFLLNFEE